MLHLIVAIVLLSAQIYSVSTGEMSFILDYSKQEAVEKKKQQELTRERLRQELDARIAAHNQPLRNVAVDASEQSLRDDRQTNVSQLRDEARQVQERLDAARRQLTQQQGSDRVPVAGESKQPIESFEGVSILSYSLGGRQVSYWYNPAYQCLGGGKVTVLIEVSTDGYVTKATVKAAGSAANTCLHEAAKRAALRSRFAPEANPSPARQKGEIVYRFVAQ